MGLCVNGVSLLMVKGSDFGICMRATQLWKMARVRNEKWIRARVWKIKGSWVQQVEEVVISFKHGLAFPLLHPHPLSPRWPPHHYSLLPHHSLQAVRALGLTSFQPFPVVHIAYSCGIRLQGHSGWVLVFSGDSRPCDQVRLILSFGSQPRTL